MKRIEKLTCVSTADTVPPTEEVSADGSCATPVPVCVFKVAAGSVDVIPSTTTDVAEGAS